MIVINPKIRHRSAAAAAQDYMRTRAQIWTNGESGKAKTLRCVERDFYERAV